MQGIQTKWINDPVNLIGWSLLFLHKSNKNSINGVEWSRIVWQNKVIIKEI